MPIFEVSKKSERTQTATFQVHKLQDLQGNDLTEKLDQSLWFRDHHELKEHLSETLRIRTEDIYLLEV